MKKKKKKRKKIKKIMDSQEYSQKELDFVIQSEFENSNNDLNAFIKS